MFNYSDVVLETLKRSGWFENRNLHGNFVFSRKKELFPAMLDIVDSLGLLKVKFVGRSGKQTIYFDVDDSLPSLKMRAEMSGYESIDDPAIDYGELIETDEDLQELRGLEENLGMKFFRIGFLEEDVGFDIYIAEDGSVYLTHGPKRIFASSDFASFLNARILSPSE